MKRLFLFSLLLAMQAAYAAKSVKFGDGVINVGDAADKVLKVAGNPINKTELDEHPSEGAAQRWYYKVGNTTITLLIRGGKVISIRDIQS